MPRGAQLIAPPGREPTNDRDHDIFPAEMGAWTPFSCAGERRSWRMLAATRDYCCYLTSYEVSPCGLRVLLTRLSCVMCAG
jgi:hypothetical protein